MYRLKAGELEKLTGKHVVENKISNEKVFRDTLNVLIGVQSSSYSFHPVRFNPIYHFYSKPKEDRYLTVLKNRILSIYSTVF